MFLDQRTFIFLPYFEYIGFLQAFIQLLCQYHVDASEYFFNVKSIFVFMAWCFSVWYYILDCCRLRISMCLNLKPF